MEIFGAISQAAGAWGVSMSAVILEEGRVWEM